MSVVSSAISHDGPHTNCVHLNQFFTYQGFRIFEYLVLDSFAGVFGVIKTTVSIKTFFQVILQNLIATLQPEPKESSKVSIVFWRRDIIGTYIQP